jgi:hypothetical protein
MTSKRNWPHKANKGEGPVRRLAHELFSELNATYYEDDPSEYLLTKVEAVTSASPDYRVSSSEICQRRSALSRSST